MRWSHRTVGDFRFSLLSLGGGDGREKRCVLRLCAAGRVRGGVMGTEGPEEDSENKDKCGDGDDPPRNFAGRIFGKIIFAGANIFGAGKLEFGESLDRWRLVFSLYFSYLSDVLSGAPFRGLRRRRDIGRDEWTLLRRRGAWGLLAIARALWFPDFMGVDLRLAQAGEIVGDGIFGVESEVLGVGANESLVEDAARKLIEVFVFDGLEHARADLGDVGNVIERELFLLASVAEFVAEFSHSVLLVAGGAPFEASIKPGWPILCRFIAKGGPIPALALEGFWMLPTAGRIFIATSRPDRFDQRQNPKLSTSGKGPPLQKNVQSHDILYKTSRHILYTPARAQRLNVPKTKSPPICANGAR